MSSVDPLDTGHEYDGIREDDNKLPRWWLLTLYGAIVFAFGYWIYFQTLGIGMNPRAAFVQELAEAKAEQAKRDAAFAASLTDDALTKMMGDPAVVQSGQAVFMANCLACHGANGQGMVGPNLTDAYWIHGDKPTDELRTIETGVPAKGMPTWLPVLGQTKVRDVAVYVMTLRGKNAPGKPPEGVDANGKAP